MKPHPATYWTKFDVVGVIIAFLVVIAILVGTAATWNFDLL